MFSAWFLLKSLCWTNEISFMRMGINEVFSKFSFPSFQLNILWDAAIELKVSQFFNSVCPTLVDMTCFSAA